MAVSHILVTRQRNKIGLTWKLPFWQSQKVPHRVLTEKAVFSHFKPYELWCWPARKDVPTLQLTTANVGNHRCSWRAWLRVLIPYTEHKKRGQREFWSHKIGRKVEEYCLQDTARSLQTQTHSRCGCLQQSSNRSLGLPTANEWPWRTHEALFTPATNRFLRIGIHYFQLCTHRNV